MDTSLVLPGAYSDSNRHTVIAVGTIRRRKAKREDVEFIPMTSSGLTVVVAPLPEFLSEYRPMNYDVIKAAKSYLKSTGHISITQRARLELEAIVNGKSRPSPEELETEVPSPKKIVSPTLTGEGVSLKTICKNLDIEPSLARRILRASKIPRVGRWAFTPDVLPQVHELLKAKAQK